MSRSHRGVMAAPGVLGALVALQMSSGCGLGDMIPSSSPRPVAATRPAGATACVAWPRPDSLKGLPLVDAETKRIAPGVVGEVLTWQSGGRKIMAWVGVDALDAFEDLDFVPVRGPAPASREWTTRVYPSLFVAEGMTRHDPPCDRLYVSTEGLPARIAAEMVADLRVRSGDAAELFGTGQGP